MQCVGRIVAAVGLAMGLGMAEVRAEARVGEPAPDFSVTDTNGDLQSLADRRGSFVVLEWFNPECPFVKKHYGSENMQTLQQTYTAQGVVWLTVNSSAPGKQGHLTAETANAYLAEHGAAQTAFLLDPDGTLGRAYGAKTTPHIFIVDPEGTLIYAGAIDSIATADPADIPQAQNFVQAVLDPAMAGGPVAVGESKAYGCSVKY